MLQRSELQRPQLSLRRLGADDEDLYCALYCDAGVMRHVGEPLTVGAARRAFAATVRINASPSWVPSYWVIEAQQQRACVGLMGMIRGASDLDAELGILIRPAWQGRGCAVEALTMLVQRAFSATPLTSLHARHAGGNRAMLGVLRRLGFAPKSPDAELSLGCQWELSREDWRLM